jgi:hypothetical protein
MLMAKLMMVVWVVAGCVWHRIHAPVIPRVTAQDAPKSKPAAF